MIKIITGNSTVDGAGVKLFRVFSHDTIEFTDPFLLLDNFGSNNPRDYFKGFPWHPHRGIETVTYMLKGDVEHQDYMGNMGVIGPGDIQWMSAGSGIIHQEMPQGPSGMYGFQLWINMPASKKMIPPKYREIKKDKVKTFKNIGINVKVIAGSYESIIGPVTDTVVDIVYLDIALNGNTVFDYTPKKDYTTLCYVYSGSGKFLTENIVQGQLVLFRDINKLTVISNSPLRFLLLSGKPLREPVAWSGPMVMNTETELQEAFKELNGGTFIKST